MLQVAGTGIDIAGERVRVEAGTGWDAVVTTTLEAGLAGLEALSGIPGSAGGTPVQNVGAYGALTSQVLTALTVYDRAEHLVAEWGPERCNFGPHRSSIFKRSERYVVLDVTYRLARSAAAAPVRYAALAEELGVDLGARPPARDVRAAVLALRARRGMLLDADDHDTWSVGSFFLNPVLGEVPDAARACPQWSDPAGTKLSAAWLIEHAGFPRGYGAQFGAGTVTLSSKHTLAVTNRGGARTADVLRFAAHVRAGVKQMFGVTLDPECDLVNCTLE